MHIRAPGAAVARVDKRYRAMAGSASRKFQFVSHPLVINSLRTAQLIRLGFRGRRFGIFSRCKPGRIVRHQFEPE